MTLRRPPTATSSRLAGRLVALLILLALAGVAIWAAVTIQQITLVERTRFQDLEHESPVEVGDLTLNLTVDREGDPMVVFLHDADIAGSILWDDVVASLPEGYGAARIDLPGFGLSSRMPEPGPPHTVAEIGSVVSEVLGAAIGRPVVLAGVGLGGKVAGEVAVAAPERTSGLVLIDVDFWDTDEWLELAQGLPWFGRAFTYSFETGGRFALGRWGSHCAEGGWCPSPEQIQERAIRVEIEETTESVYGFIRTASAAQVPSRLDQVAVPVVLVHSTQGDVPAVSIQRLIDEELPALSVVEIDVFQAHLETPGEVAAAIVSVAG